jgi:tRNA dimethylallyltransferase
LTPLLVVVGPTASGKTELALELASRIDGEIVSADSVQVYRHFQIGTGKPSQEERARVPHHLIDIREPDEALDAASWAQLARACLFEIASRGKRPIVCGGTFLWVRALLYGLAPTPPGSAEIRERHRIIAEARGRAALHGALTEVDPESAQRLAPNDLVRVSRALEVFELTGQPLSRWHAAHGFRESLLEARLLGVHRERPELDQRIFARATSMLNSGWVDEVRELKKKGYGDARAMGAVGYKQIAEALGTGAPFELPELVESIARKTRIFARRQRTWLRDQEVEWLDVADGVVNAARRALSA